MRRLALLVGLAAVGVAQAPEKPTTTVTGDGWRVEVYGPRVDVRQEGDVWLVVVRP